MTDLELIYLILAVFYLAECGHWVRPGSLVFVSQLGERPRLRSAYNSALLRNDSGGVLFGNLLAPGYSLQGRAWPLSLSPWGIVSATRQTLTPDQSSDGAKQFLSWERVRGVRAEGRELIIEGQLFIKAGCVEQSRMLASVLNRLAELTEDQREPAIIDAVQRTLDRTSFADSFRASRRHTAALVFTCSGLFLYLFVAAPYLLESQVCQNLLGVLPGYFGFLGLTILIFRRAHRAMGRALAERWSSTFTMLVSPADAIHCRDRLLRPLAADYHPLTVASVLSHPDDFRDLARYVLLDAHFPLRSAADCNSPSDPVAVEAWFHERWIAVLHAFLRGAGLEPEALARPPQPESPECSNYCPRCHGQYLWQTISCSTCGLALQDFSAPPPPAPKLVALPGPQLPPPAARKPLPAKKRECRRK